MKIGSAGWVHIASAPLSQQVVPSWQMLELPMPLWWTLCRVVVQLGENVSQQNMGVEKPEYLS